MLPGVFDLLEEVIQAVTEDEDDDHGNDPGHVPAHPVCNLETVAGVGLRGELLPAPAVTADAEDGENQRTGGQQDIADQEVFKVHDAQTQDGHMAQDGEAQDAGHSQNGQGNAADQACLLALPAGQVTDAGNDVLEDREDGGHGCEGHEDEEQGAPQAAAHHVVEDVGQGDEHQAGTGICFHTEGGAGREDDQTGGEGHEGVQADDVDSLAHQRTLLLQVAAEDGHGADAQAQGEEGLVHGSDHDVAHTGFGEAVPAGQQVELQTLSGTVQHAAVDSQHDHDGQQSQHHPLGDPLQTALQAERADDGCHCHDGDGVESHGTVVLGHGREHAGDAIGIQTDKLTQGGVHKVLDHPAGDGAVAHQQDDVAGKSEVAVDMPLGTLIFQFLIHQDGALLGCAAHCKFHSHNGQTQQDQACQIDQNKDRTAVLAGDIGEFPDVADADGTAGAEQDEAEAASEMFALHIKFPPKRKTKGNYTLLRIKSQYVSREKHKSFCKKDKEK